MILLVMFHKFYQSFISVLYPRPIGCIDDKCLTKCQSRLGMLRPSPKVDFLFIIIVIMSLMDSEGCTKFWAEVGILG